MKKKKMQSDVERKKKKKFKIKIKIKPSGQNQRVNKEIVGQDKILMCTLESLPNIEK